MNALLRFAPCFVLAALTAGCGGSARPIDAAGTAKLDGAALEMGRVVFAPEGGGESKSGEILADGTFKLYALVPGKYQVAVQTAQYASLAASQGAQVGGQAITMREVKGKFRAVPAKFENAQTSGLTVEVKPGQPIELDLKSGG